MAKARSLITKGRTFQVKICNMIKETFGLSEDHCRSAIGAETGIDIKLSKEAQKIVGLSIECKNQKSMGIWAGLKQAKKNTIEGTHPALVFHRSVSGNEDIWIAIPIEHYLDIRKRLYEEEGLW